MGLMSHDSVSDAGIGLAVRLFSFYGKVNFFPSQLTHLSRSSIFVYRYQGRLGKAKTETRSDTPQFSFTKISRTNGYQ